MACIKEQQSVATALVQLCFDLISASTTTAPARATAAATPPGSNGVTETPVVEDCCCSSRSSWRAIPRRQLSGGVLHKVSLHRTRAASRSAKISPCHFTSEYKYISNTQALLVVFEDATRFFMNCDLAR